MSVRGECGDDGWVLSVGEAPLSRWFLVELVSAFAISVDSISSGWVKIDVGLMMA